MVIDTTGAVTSAAILAAAQIEMVRVGGGPGAGAGAGVRIGGPDGTGAEE